MEAVLSYIPNKTITIRSKDKEWMTGRIRYLIKKRDRLYKRFTKSKSVICHADYDEACRNVKDAIAQKNNTLIDFC